MTTPLSLPESKTSVDYVPWAEFMTDKHFRWEQGEHLTIIGPTGQGKTTLALNLLPLRKYVVAFATKPKDKVMDNLSKHGYKKMTTWKALSPRMYPRRILWPTATNLYSADAQAAEFQKALEAIYSEGGWCLFLDELWYVQNHLGLGREVKTYLLQARSLEISLLLLAQRPAWIPVEVFDMSTHLFFFRDNDRTNLERIGNVGYVDSRLIRETVARMPEHHCLYINSRTGEMVYTLAPRRDE